MTPFIALSILLVYFGVLMIIAFITSKGATTDTFFSANKQSKWYWVAVAMIGTSISGVTFVSVPGGVKLHSFSYFQMVLGYLMGYLFIGTVLMPLYYRLGLVSIYSYLHQRLGFFSYKTGSAFFLLSRTLGSAVRLYIAAKILQLAIYTPLGIPFEISVFLTIALIWLYTFKGGIKTIIITDTLQTFFLIIAVFFTIVLITKELGLNSFTDLSSHLYHHKYSQVFFFDDFFSKKNFFKQFISGAVITLVMTGLDQDLMQKNLTCKNIKEAQKNMFTFVFILVFVNILFLSLGALLYSFSESHAIAIPSKTDDLYPMLALKYFASSELGLVGLLVGITFLIGITAATYASSDSALTALTTAFCIDFMAIETKPEIKRQKIKHRVHIGFSLLFYVIILIFNQLNKEDVINVIFKIASYTYGPLLGLFIFGLYTKNAVKDRFVPVICLISPLITYIIVNIIENQTPYRFQNENLLLNGFLTFIGLFCIRQRK